MKKCIRCNSMCQIPFLSKISRKKNHRRKETNWENNNVSLSLLSSLRRLLAPIIEPGSREIFQCSENALPPYSLITCPTFSKKKRKFSFRPSSSPETERWSSPADFCPYFVFWFVCLWTLAQRRPPGRAGGGEGLASTRRPMEKGYDLGKYVSNTIHLIWTHIVGRGLK